MLATNDRTLAKELKQRRPLCNTRFDLLAATRAIFIVTLFVLTLSIHFDLIEARTADVLKVQLPHGGVLVGRHRVSHKGRHMRAFMGVPYALPPVGELRFKPPVPYGAWVGERHAIQDSPKCIQRDPYRRDIEIEGSEDCLYLNVYTPEELPNTAPLPVMVYIHGGGFQCGSGISSFYGPEFLLDQDVILVIGNYRVGPLGFLSTETLDCPGNFGLKDQVEILRWVQQNIAAFGGDPTSVTIFGNSAGGASVTYHMLSNSSKGLFHKAIAQSGTYYNPWAQPQYKDLSANRARTVAQLVDCDAEAKWPELLNCLRTKSAKEVVATLYELFEWDYDPMVPFQPVIEPPHEGAFLTLWPRDVGLPHGFSLPFMIGATSEEGLLKTAPLLNIPGLLDEYKQQFDTILPIELQYDHHPPEVRAEITRQIEEFYFKEGHTYDKYNHQNLTDLISDGWFIAGIDEYIRQRVDAKKSLKMPPFYVYLFEHRSPASFSELFKGGREDYYGACHAEELQYLFPVAMELFVSASPTKSDIELRDAMLKMWVNFAREGNPTPEDFELPKWDEANSYPVNYARLGHKTPEEFTILQMESDIYVDRMSFWHQLSPHVPAEERKGSQKDEL
ncbi:carboxylic ester hydrolase isoform X1 [Anastrepha ludens]|uniref:carboxylic ester hydrolase isoform X1 n=2 Tax=Anastrepha ludens TaxID=28586 RepID=UPI0023B1E401|nr:carboxylic ester hydrolase isoform X1 [Anastrepha ludens]